MGVGCGVTAIGAIRALGKPGLELSEADASLGPSHVSFFLIRNLTGRKHNLSMLWI